MQFWADNATNTTSSAWVGGVLTAKGSGKIHGGQADILSEQIPIAPV